MSVLKTWISLVVVLSLVLIGCGKEPSCTDGIQNQGETGIDCCAEGTLCTICPVCVLNPEDTITIPDPMDTMMTSDDPLITAKVNGADWSSNTAVGIINIDGFLKLNGIGSADGSEIEIVYSQDFVAGDYSFDGTSGNFGSYSTVSQVDYVSSGALGGNLIFSTFDTINKVVSGTFEFSAVNQADSTDVLQITEGVFSNIDY